MSQRKYNYLMLVFLIGIISVIVIRGNLGNFINVKMINYIYISLFLLVIFMIREIFSGGSHVNEKKFMNLICFVFFIIGIIGINRKIEFTISWIC